MNAEHVDIHVKGKPVRAVSTCVDGRTVIASGKWLKTAAVMDEELLEGEIVQNPDLFVSTLKTSELRADIFTFAQKVPDTTPKHKYHLEWDNAAVIPISTFSDWWEKRAEYDVRKAVKRAKKLGVVVKLSEYNDEFVEGICRIYNESPLRQGSLFTHYQKDFDSVKRENSTYLERSAYIGAYYNDELIGFIRMVYVGSIATTLQVISQKKHFDKKPTNALIAKAVEVCEMRGVSHFVYGSYVYNDPNSSLTEFKRRNGFEPMFLPRYYIPMTLKGKIALRANLHHQAAAWIPGPILGQLRRIRSLWYSRKVQSLSEAL
ncbi:MAG: hypothetical protein LAN63_14600 [Acidobacteriia bacterium]|nr:hypothetical protein [Terriglobia bacterium]